MLSGSCFSRTQTVLEITRLDDLSWPHAVATTHDNNTITVQSSAAEKKKERNILPCLHECIMEKLKQRENVPPNTDQKALKKGRNKGGKVCARSN